MEAHTLWGSVLVSLLASQAHRHHGHLTNFWCFWQSGQVSNPAGKLACVVEIKEWMQRICLCFTPSRIALESAHLFRDSVRFQLVFFCARDIRIFKLHNLTDFHVERLTAHRIKINDHSCFHNLWPNVKTKLKLKHIWEQGAPWCFRSYKASVFCV